jgi:ribonuclease HII
LSYPNFNIEKKIGGTVIGIDEVGRGPLAGPVVSCACIFFDYSIEKFQLSLFDDSKKLTIKKRCDAFHKVYQLKNDNKLQFALGFANVFEIDKFNILEAAKISMRRAVQKLHYEKANLIIDGRIDLQLSQHKSNGIIKGDQKSYSIATASIIAKIHRDRYMRHLSLQHPCYDWDKNAGYGTKKHIEQINKKGVTDHHRKSFEPIKSLIHI